MEIKAVVFDIDGTLYPGRKMAWQTLPLILTNLNLFRTFSFIRKELRREEFKGDIWIEQTKRLAQTMKIEEKKANSPSTTKNASRKLKLLIFMHRTVIYTANFDFLNFVNI